MMSVGVFSFGRTGSQRCPNKMLRPFAGTTLTDIVLEKLKRCGEGAFFAGFEPAFKQKAKSHGVAFMQRDERSASIDGPITEILSFLRQAEFTHLLLVSACLPLLRAETILHFLNSCKQGSSKPAFGVRCRQNYFMSLSRKPLNFNPEEKTINTKTVEPVYEFAHALYFFERDYFFTMGTYWDWRTVELIALPNTSELIDVDTEEDFAMAEAVWHARKVVHAA